MFRVSIAVCVMLLPVAAAADPSLNPDVRQDTLATTICSAGYTKAIRPASNYTSGIKIKLVQSMGEPDEAVALYELDHIVPLALGGHPRSLDNLQLQAWDVARRKDRIEVKMQCLVCSGQIALADAQRQIVDDWQAAYHRWAPVVCHRDKTDPNPWWRGLFDRVRWVVAGQ